jgi:hypothetical protein
MTRIRCPKNPWFDLAGSWAILAIRLILKGFVMFKKKGKCSTFYFLSSVLCILAGLVSAAEENLDKSKYITIDEIKPGMKAYCLTTYKGTEIEKFEMEVLDVVRNVQPGRDAILVQGKDERFIHTGPVAGCSGSPVYIDGRLAGALAFGWFFSKDPLYGVTPIEEMFRVGKKSSSERGRDRPGFAFDFSRPINFAEVNEKISTRDNLNSRSQNSVYARALPCPLVTSGLPAGVCEQLNSLVEPYGLMAVAGMGNVAKASEDDKNIKKASLSPGSTLAVPIVTGDITMAVIGTVTEVVDDRVYGFGHSFLGYGSVDLPMATGQIHTVVSNVARSFKLGSFTEIVGALQVDESAAVYGHLGAKAKMIPLTIRVERYNDVEKRVYNCQVADNRILTPRILSAVIEGAALMLGELPPDNTVEYGVNIGIEGFKPIVFENISTGMGLNDVIEETIGSVALLMNNPYKDVKIKSLDIKVRELPKNISAHIWSVNLSDSAVKAGEKIDVKVIVESVLTGKKQYQCSFKMPENIQPGPYTLMVCGPESYQKFLVQTVPYRFMPENMDSLIEVLNNLLSIKRGKLYCLLVLQSDGIAVERTELPDLPATKAMVLADAKRSLKVQPYQYWLEETTSIDAVVVDEKAMQITIKK